MFILALQQSSVFKGRAGFGGSDLKFCLAEKKGKKNEGRGGKKEVWVKFKKSRKLC